MHLTRSAAKKTLFGLGGGAGRDECLASNAGGLCRLEPCSARFGNAAFGDRAVIRVDLVARELPAMTCARDRRRAAAHERIEHAPTRRTAREHHALDDLQRLLRRMIHPLRVLP